MDGSNYGDGNKIRILLGESFLDEVRGKTVIDFGCGEGNESLELVRKGASRVIGIDTRESVLSVARDRALNARMDHLCEFGTWTKLKADVILSLDCFEHCEDPAAVLAAMFGLLNAEGFAMISFGPTWYHPLGGHLFSVFPWAHLLFSENALIRWRSDLRNDGATRFSEVEGGLNQMTIKRFEGLVRESGFSVAFSETVPIRKLKMFHNRYTREFTTAIVRCKLVK